MKKVRILIGSHLRKLRVDHCLSQKEVAQYLGISVQVYSLYETDKNEPSLSIVIGLAELYGTTVDNILNI